jgi:hypothetical protein
LEVIRWEVEFFELIKKKKERKKEMLVGKPIGRSRGDNIKMNLRKE